MVSGFVLPVLVYYSVVWCSAADTHIKLLDRVGTDAWWHGEGVPRTSSNMTVLCMYSKHPLSGTLPVPYMPVLITRGALVAHRYIYPSPRSATGLLFPSQCSLE